MTRVKEIKTKLQTIKDLDELSGYLIDCGKNLNLSNAEKMSLNETIYTYCDHFDSLVRSVAIRVLCFYWGMQEYRDKAFEMTENDPDEDTREDALMSWANTYRNSNNRKVMEFLLEIISNTKQRESLRHTAYASFFTVSLLTPKDYPNLNLDWDNFENEIDWELIEGLLK